MQESAPTRRAVRCSLAVGLLFALGSAGSTAWAAPDPAQRPAPPDAVASDPATLGWMVGSPPPPERMLRFEDGSYFAFPALRWSVSNFRQLMPTVNVSRGLGAPAPLPRAERGDIDSLSFTPLGGSAPMSWSQSLLANYTDGIVVLHRGRVVYERYFGVLKEDGQHGLMSISKSLVGTLGAMLVAEGRLDAGKTVADTVPELARSAFGSATLRQVLDMTTGIRFSEDYADPRAEVWQHAAAGNPLPKPKDYTGPRSYHEFLQTVQPEGRHGEAFGYKTANADALGWVLARATGRTVAQLLSERIWRHLGAEQDAYFSVDSTGTPFAGGGMNAGLRDLARFGEMLRNDGMANGRRVLPKAAIDDIRRGGRPSDFAQAGYALLPGWSYRNMWWVTHNEHGAFMARGVHGQALYIDPRAEMVIARFASHPVAGNAANDPTTLPAFHALAQHLMAQAEPNLVGGEWVIEDIAGAGVIDNTHASLHFLPDGHLAGNATCNRLIGRYRASGGKLSLTPAGTTMMACPEALMNQERKLLDLLPTVRSYRLDGSGALVLTTRDGKTITARR